MASGNIQVGSTVCSFFYGDPEARDTVVERVTEYGPEAVVKFQCPYASRLQVAQTLMGTVVWTGSQVVRLNPFQYPPLPYLYCLEIASIVGLNPIVDHTGWQSYKSAVITAVFRRPLYPFINASPATTQADPSGQPYTVTRFSSTVDMVPAVSGSFRWASGSTTGANAIVPDNIITQLQSQTQITMTRYMMPYIPLNYFEQFKWNVNLNPIAFSDHTYPKGTVLFWNIESEPTADSAGNYSQNVTYVMLAKAHDWNMFPNPKDTANPGALDFATSTGSLSGSPVYPYPYSDFFTNLP